MAVSFIAGQHIQQRWDKEETIILDEAYQDLIMVIYQNQPDLIEDWLCETDEWKYLSTLNDNWIYLKKSLKN